MDPIHRTHQALIHILPSEILRDIFFILSKQYGCVHLHSGSLRASKVPPQIYVSHVCSKWRHVALNARLLWVDVQIFNPPKDDPWCRLWLSRAGQCLTGLSLAWLDFKDHPEISESEFVSIIHELVHPFPITSLHLIISCQRLSQLSNLPDNSLPTLEELNIDFRLDDEDEEVSEMPLFISKTRSAIFGVRKSNHFSSQEFNQIIRAMHLAWTGLTSLEISFGVYLSDCVTLFRQAQSLTDCNITVLGVDVGSSEELVMPCLLELTFDGSMLAEDIDQVIQHFTCPSLTSLSLLRCFGCRASKTYDIIARQYNLRRLQHLRLQYSDSRGKHIPISTILKDAPMLHTAKVPDITIIDPEILDVIRTESIGRNIESLFTSCEEADIEAVLNILETVKDPSNIEHDMNSGSLGRLVDLRIRVLRTRSGVWYRKAMIRELHDMYAPRLDRLEQYGTELEFI